LKLSIGMATLGHVMSDRKRMAEHIKPIHEIQMNFYPNPDGPAPFSVILKACAHTCTV
jgi:hypothetical protein